jgi:hypothetical protein
MVSQKHGKQEKHYPHYEDMLFGVVVIHLKIMRFFVYGILSEMNV